MIHRWRKTGVAKQKLRTTLLLGMTFNFSGGCDVTDYSVQPPRIPLDGTTYRLLTEIVTLGPLREGEVIRVSVEGDGISQFRVLVKARDSKQGFVVVSGGRARRDHTFRIPESAEYALQIPNEAEGDLFLHGPRVAVSRRDPDYRPPSEQRVLVVFEPGFLSDPGLHDPTADDAEIRKAFFESVSGVVQNGVLERLRFVFDDTPIRILDENMDELPEEPYSRITLCGNRVQSAEGCSGDSVPGSITCDDSVFFGRVLPEASQEPACLEEREGALPCDGNAQLSDLGNQDQKDRAVVYVGSFQGRGPECFLASVDSVNAMIMGLSHTAAHEIGHLIGLEHVALNDIMKRSPTEAFQRELGICPGQLVEDRGSGAGAGEGLVSTMIHQDPIFYLRANFDWNPPSGRQSILSNRFCVSPSLREFP